MLEIPENNISERYKIKLIVAVEKNSTIGTRNEILIPRVYHSLEEARENIEMDIKSRLKNNMYFRSQKLGYELVRYSQTASVNTYITYRVMPVSDKTFKPIDIQRIS
ncbi:MAG: hypothetical protein OEZ13_09955 [Spirochaetia bacterium]|nr:hypothetical protein [Spirochaetia bacterium]